MKLPKLVKTSQQLRKLLRQGADENMSSWHCLGPCPEFIKTPATEFVVDGEAYIVLMFYSDFKAFQKDMEAKDKARDKGCIEG